MVDSPRNLGFPFKLAAWFLMKEIWRHRRSSRHPEEF